MRKTILFAISLFLFSILYLISPSHKTSVQAQSCADVPCSGLDMSCSYTEPSSDPDCASHLNIVTGHPNDPSCTGLNRKSPCACEYCPGCSLVECYKPFTTTVFGISVPGLSAIFSESDLPTQIVTAILPAILGITGFISIIIIIISGIQFISSSGNPEGAAAARGRLTFALIGFAVIVLAFLVLQIIDRVFLQTRVV